MRKWTRRKSGKIADEYTQLVQEMDSEFIICRLSPIKKSPSQCGSALAAVLAAAGPAVADASSEMVTCDATADYPMLTQNYPQAVRLHLRVLAEHPDNALGHYHLGFAYGMLGDHAQELVQYRKAADLGLKRWDLFVNLGLANLEADDLDAAAAALTEAVAIQPNRPEPHFNLGLVYERRGMLPEAEREFRTSLQLDPNQPDAGNMLGVIHAEQQDIPSARRIWTELVSKYPNYGPAHENLSSAPANNRNCALESEVKTLRLLSLASSVSSPSGGPFKTVPVRNTRASFYAKHLKHVKRNVI